MSQYFLGVDGGQSSTRACIGDETGRIVGVGGGGPCNHVSGAEARAKFVAAIQSSLRAACAQAGLDIETVRFAGACLGFSGGPGGKEPILSEILPSDRTLVTDDALIALTGATAGNPGLVVIAGTGSIAFGRNGEGRPLEPVAGVIFLGTRAAPSGLRAKPSGPRCDSKKAGV